MSRNHDSTLREGPLALPPVSQHQAWLAVLACPESDKVGARFPLSTEEPLLLGRQIESGGIAFGDPRISRLHARVAWDGRTACFRIADLGSENGLFIDGARARIANLRHGSVLRIGDTVCTLAGRDPVAELEQRTARAAPSEACVLLLGESGTGKERVARRLHELSGRLGEFVAVNTAALPRELLSSELFGHKRGAFSGARDDRAGLFRAAHRGTLFLDEIGDFPLELQPSLLRALEERAVRPVGSEREVPLSVRVIAATHQDLHARVTDGSFRLDLHARLAEIELSVPALRERTYSLPNLIAEFARDQGLTQLTVSADAMERLALHPFPQNVRELKNLVARLKIFGAPPFRIDLAFLEQEAPRIGKPRESTALPAEPGEQDPAGLTRGALVDALARHDDRVVDVAREFGKSRAQVYRWLKRFGLEPRARRKS